MANPLAAQNYEKLGVPQQKIIQSSYGWDPGQIRRCSSSQKEKAPFVALYVGVTEMRKGVDKLIRAWVRANVKGKLVIGGPLSTELEWLCREELNRDDIVVTGWVNDVAPLYRDADIFVFPSHEEGGPQVTYEAMGAGLPVVVSPMGASVLVRNGLDGFIVDQHDEEGWVEAIRTLSENKHLRQELAENAYQRALEFTWEMVGARRREAVQARLR